MILLCTAGIYLISVGCLMLLSDMDIYVGFLWVIDLGVGLVFFIFILHFTTFLFQKSSINLSFRYFIYLNFFFITFLFFTYYMPLTADTSSFFQLSKTWYYKLSYIDYYLVYNTYEVTDLSTLKDTYFLLNSFEFYLVNFSLFFGLLISILLCFLTQRIFNFLNYSQIVNWSLLKKINSNFFMRNQNFIKQQNTSPTVRVWQKN